MKRILFNLTLIFTFAFLLVGCTTKNNSSNNNNPNTQEKHVHSYSTTVVDATCATDGYKYHYCSGCGDNYKDNIIKAFGHNYVEREQNYKCSRCERYEDEGFSFEIITAEMARYNDNYKGRINTYEIKSANSKSVDGDTVTLPRKHMGLPVTGIYRGALYNVRSAIKKLVINDNIKFIGSNLFCYDGQMNNPNGGISLEIISFSNSCTGINISHSAFQYCKNVNEISMTNNCISLFNHDDNIGNHFLFEDTEYYKSNRIEENGLYYLFDMLLESDKSKVNSNVVVKSGTRIIANQVFAGNTNIKTIELPNSIIYIGKKAFAQCVSLTTIKYNGTITQYNSILIEDNSFKDCKNISYQFG